MSDLPVPDPNADFRTQALDIQHDTDPARDHGVARRIPHLGHAAFFFAIMGSCLLMIQTVVLIAVKATTKASALQHPFALAMSEIASYAVTFAIAIPVFPFLWHRSFFQGIHWTGRQAVLRWWKLILLGCALSIIVQSVEYFSNIHSTSDISQLLKTPLAAWTTVLLAVLVAPAVEEIAFRGFLLPAFATAYDWLALERTPAGRDRWQRTTDHTRAALLFGALISSIPFAAIHGSQLHWAKAPVAMLFMMSLALSAVRVRTRSVAASTLVHASYNALLMIEVIVGTHGFQHLDKL